MYRQMTFSLTELIDRHYMPERVFSYCAECPHHNQIHTCPPHHVLPQSLLRHGNLITVCALTLAAGADMDPLAEYLHQRQILDALILDVEPIIQGFALIPGRCVQCDPCSRTSSLECTQPRKMRYSLESLGFMVSDIMADEFAKPLEWNPMTRTFVFAYVHFEEISCDLKEYFKILK